MNTVKMVLAAVLLTLALIYATGAATAAMYKTAKENPETGGVFNYGAL